MLREKKNPTIRNFINKFCKIIFPLQKVNDQTLDRVTELRAHYPIQHIYYKHVLTWKTIALIYRQT